MKREVLALILAVLIVDVIFMGAYLLIRVRAASDPAKLAFTALWTLVTLAIVIRGLARIRGARLRRFR